MPDKFVSLASEVPQTSQRLTLLKFQVLLDGHLVVCLVSVTLCVKKTLDT
jgi:hypothetical protein